MRKGDDLLVHNLAKRKKAKLIIPDDPVWVPQLGSQEDFLMCPIPEVLFEGTRGPGKTDALLMDFEKDCCVGHGAAWKGILFRQTYKQLTDVITKSSKWFSQTGKNPRFNHSEHYWKWPTGEVLLFRQFKRVSDYDNYHGHEYPWIGGEELCNWSNDEGYKKMFSTNRTSVKGVPKRIRSTTNPYGPGHNWVKHRFRLPGSRYQVITDSYDDDGKLEPARVAIHGYLAENLILLDADPDYITNIRASASSDAELKAWLHGSWDIVAGGMFDDVWSPTHNLCAPFDIPPTWRIDRSFDWGSSAPFSVGWWAASDGSDVRLRDGTIRSTVRGDLFRIAEWYGWNGKPNKGLKLGADMITKGIIEREILWGFRNGNISRVKAGVADSAIFAVEDNHSIAASMYKMVRIKGQKFKGLQWMRADKSPGSRKTGWQVMREWFSNAHPNDDGTPREHAGLFVFDTCTQFMRTIPVLPRDDKDMDDVDTDAEDHIADEVRYKVRSVGKHGKIGRTTGDY